MLVGRVVGVAVGRIVGVEVGLRVGVAVGRTVGVAVGPRVGDRVGREVGVDALGDVPEVVPAGVGEAVVMAEVVSADVEAEVSVWLAEVEAVGSDVSDAVVMAVSLVLVASVVVVDAVVVAAVVEMLEVRSAGRSWQAVRVISKIVKTVRRMMKPFLARPARLILRISLIRAFANGLPQLS